VIDRDSEQLVFCPQKFADKSREFLKNGVGSSGPHEGLGADEVGAGIDLAGRCRRLVARHLGEARDAADWFSLGLLCAGIEQDDPRSGRVNFKPLAVNRAVAAGDVFQHASAGVEKGAVDLADTGELADVDILLQHKFDEFPRSGFWIRERAIWDEFHGVGAMPRLEWVRLLATRRPQSRNAHMFSP
jgi:hypothetical protein